ncbi:Streptomycin adenylyltransferase [Chryseobacterium sp. MOF25P]|nr:Streptomycin adenylyltransferase [Chryseobacterium sp. MOF25P]OBW47562.1 Streptomycin adenylyltransferase [Chryseobacterium sp. BGARF1]
MKAREEKLRSIINWSENNEDVRAVLLTSSLVNPLAPVDEFSDLDIELIFEITPNIFQIRIGFIILEIQLP